MVHTLVYALTHTLTHSRYVLMRDALNATGRPIWFSITERVAYNDSQWHKNMHCIHPPRPAGYPNEYGAFTVRPWIHAGKDVPSLANSYLIEYCNNNPTWGYTNGVVPTPHSPLPEGGGTQASPGTQPAGAAHPGGFLSQLDSQQLLTYDNLTVPGAFNDNDMLENCNGNMTKAECV